ncbi:Vps5 C terminal like-domain-containing protein [Scleroderma citrinum]
MDGFDDLLASSRNALEDNPFADPFAQTRPESPDPWASFGQVQQDSQSQVDYFKSGFADQHNVEQYTTHFDQGSSHAAVDPLDAAARTANVHEDEKIPHTTRIEAETDTPSHTPGFGIFTSSPGSDIKEVGEPDLPSRKHSDPSTLAGDVSDTRPALLPSQNLASSSKQPSPISEHITASPLEGPPSPGLSQAISSVVFQDDVHGGWQSSWQSNGHVAAFTPPAPATQITTEEDDDDDTPIGQTAKFQNWSAERAGSIQVSLVTRSDPSIPPLFVISVDGPQKVGDPIRSFIMYTVHTRTSSPLFSKSSFSVLRRYSDFLWLYETLSMNNPGVIVPPVPEKNTFGRFDENFVQQRRLALEKCIQKMANHPVLAKDSDLRFFLESDTFALDMKHRKVDSAHERGGLMASIGQTLTGPRFHETDEWFDKQRAYLDGLESQLRGLVKSIDIVAKHRSELAAATKDFATAISELSASELGPQLKQSLAALADVKNVAAEAQSTQSQQDVVTLMSTADEYSRLVSSVRMAFNSRIRTYTSWQNADAEVRRARQMHDRAKAQGRLPTDRVGHTVSLVAEAERRALDAKHEFDQCSKLIKSEMSRFEQERVEDFKNVLQAFLDGMISRQKELIGAWENYQQLLLSCIATAG